MSITLPPIGSQISCSYRNSTDRMVILRCCGPDRFFLERVVFPFELLSFGCPADAEVTIWSHGLGGAELVEAMQAAQLISDAPGREGASARHSPGGDPFTVVEKFSHP